MTDDDAELAAALERVVAAGPVTGLRRLSAGTGREMWFFDAGDLALVLRRDPPSRRAPAVMAKEAACLRAAAVHGVPVLRLRFAGDGSDGVGSPYLVTDRVDGESRAPRLLRDERFAEVRPRLPRDLGRVLARIHAIPCEEVPGLEESDRLADLRARHDVFGVARPAVELALRWLGDHRPDPVPTTLVHGDFRNGNLVVDSAGVRAVLDWELARAGDPREDLGWLCAKVWRFGAVAPVGGFGSRDELLDGYAEVAGVRPDPAAVHWWEVFAAVRWAVTCRARVERHLDGAETSVELAVLGRREAEAEHDALLALDLTTAAPAPDPIDVLPDPDADVLRVRPTADELLAALGCRDDAELAGDIRSGVLDVTDPSLVEAVRAATTARVLMTDPHHLAAPP